MNQKISMKMSIVYRIALCLIVLSGFAAMATAQTTTFTYQGRLSVSGVSPTAEYDLRFNLHDQLSGANPALETESSQPPVIPHNFESPTRDVENIQMKDLTTRK